MEKPGRLKVEEVRAAMRVVGECRDVGDNPAAWNLRVAAFFQERLRAVFTNCFSCTFGTDGMPTAHTTFYSFWADNRLFARWKKFVADRAYRQLLTVQRLCEKVRPNDATYYGATFCRQDLVPDGEWLACTERADRKAFKQDEILLSCQPWQDGVFHVFSVNRGDGDSRFTLREQSLVRLIHEELGLLFGGKLNLKPDPAAFPNDLPPRLQSVLICLLSGESEKQIAGRLDLSQHTVHEYAMDLYKRFDVRSRAELLAFAHRRGWMPTFPRGTATPPQ